MLMGGLGTAGLGLAYSPSAVLAALPQPFHSSTRHELQEQLYAALADFNLKDAVRLVIVLGMRQCLKPVSATCAPVLAVATLPSAALPGHSGLVDCGAAAGQMYCDKHSVDSWRVMNKLPASPRPRLVCQVLLEFAEEMVCPGSDSDTGDSGAHCRWKCAERGCLCHMLAYDRLLHSTPALKAPPPAVAVQQHCSLPRVLGKKQTAS